MTHVSIREAPGHSLGRCTIQGGNAVDDFTASKIMIAGHVAERMSLGRDPRPNWFLDDDHDPESARLFIQRSCTDELEGRQLAQVQTRALLLTRWNAVQAIAEKLQRDTTLTGAEVADICRREGVGRHGERLLTREEAMKKMTPAGRRKLMGTVATDGKTIIEKATSERR